MMNNQAQSATRARISGYAAFVSAPTLEFARTMTFLSTTTVFGTPVDITLSEIALECFYPADDVTAEILRGMGSSPHD